MITPIAIGGGALAALTVTARVAHSVLTRGAGGLFNDFYDYWAAARMLNEGRNPYDTTALIGVQQAAGLQSTAGSGYSYPLFFAHLLRPLAVLPAFPAALLFTIMSLLALAGATAFLLSSLPSLTPATALGGGLLTGLFPPVIGSAYFGQANLLVLLLLAVAYRQVLPGPLLAVATAVKLYPLTGYLAGIARGPAGFARLPGSLALLALLLVVPQWGASGSLTGRAGYFLGPDTYWSNESINGWISRLALPSTWTRPPLPGLPVTATMVIAVLALLAGTMWVLVRSHGVPWTGCFALALALGAVSAPKNSLWNFTPLLLAVAFAWPLARRRPWALAIGVTGWLMIEAQAQLDSYRETVYRANPALAWLSSTGLYGALLIAGLAAVLLLMPVPRPRPPSR